MIAMPVIDRSTRNVHITISGTNRLLCGTSINTGLGIVAAPDKEVDCLKCKEACSELITTLQACLPHEPSVGELGLIPPIDDGSAVMDGATRPRDVYNYDVHPSLRES